MFHTYEYDRCAWFPQIQPAGYHRSPWAIYVFRSLYYLYERVRVGVGDESLITPMALTHPLHPIRSRPRNQGRNLWVGSCVFSWRPWVWSIYPIYYLSNWNKLFLRDIYTSRVVAMAVCWMIWYCYSFLYGFKCVFHCIIHDSLYHFMDISAMWHCAFVSCTPSQSTGLALGCALFWCSVSSCVPFYEFLDWVLFDHDSCDYYWDFHGQSFYFELHV